MAYVDSLFILHRRIFQQGILFFGETQKKKVQFILL